jgi:hypothetical protein
MRKLRRTTGFCIAILVGAGGAPAALAAKPVILDVKNVDQEQSEWCWAACSEMIIEHVSKPELVDAQQCEIAAIEYWVDPSVDCCAASVPSECNPNGAFPWRTFDQFGIQYETYSNLYWSGKRGIVRQIDNDRPMFYSWYWDEASQTGHSVVIYGYHKTKKQKWVYRLDPNLYEELPTESYIVDLDYLKTFKTWLTIYDISK